MTIRQHLEAQIEDADWIIHVYATRGVTSLLVQRAQAIREHAVAALDDLGNAERSYGNGTRPDDVYRLVPDPVAAATPASRPGPPTSTGQRAIITTGEYNPSPPSGT